MDKRPNSEDNNQTTKRAKLAHKSDVAVPRVVPMDCKTPPSFAKQHVVNAPLVSLDNKNYLLNLGDILDPLQLKLFLEDAMKVKRYSSKSAFGKMKPRKEVCYSPDGSPYVYSGIAHPTLPYPQHVRKLLDVVTQKVQNWLYHVYTQPTMATDILYDDTFLQGGSIGEHKDDEDDWGMVCVFSLGQSRYLRVKRVSDGQMYNVKMKHNSLVVMLGETFQKEYTHRVDKLSKNEPVGARLSLNVRFKKPK